MQIIGKEAAWASLVSARQQKSPPFYLLGKGVTDLAEPLIKALASLSIVPHACAQIASATCTCGDFFLTMHGASTSPPSATTS